MQSLNMFQLQTPPKPRVKAKDAVLPEKPDMIHKATFPWI